MSMNRQDVQGNSYNTQLVDSIQNLIGAYTSGQLTSATPVGVSGQAIANLPSYAGQISQPGVTTTGQSAAAQMPRTGAVQATQRSMSQLPSTQTLSTGSNSSLSALSATR